MVRKELLHVIGGVRVFRDPVSGVIFFRSKMTIDDDGDPRAYGPGGKGRDFLANAGHPGNWWGIATDLKGKPIQQKIDDPAPGMYVSTTSLQNPKYKFHDPRRYTNAGVVPYVALPAQLFSHVKLGDLGTAFNKGLLANFIVADSGGRGHIGEGSPALANWLGIPEDPKKGGTESLTVDYVIYPHTGTGMLLSKGEIDERVKAIIGAKGVDPKDFTQKNLSQKNPTRKVVIKKPKTS